MKQLLPVLIAALLTFFSAAVFADTALLEKARALQASGKAAEAYQMLQKQSDKYAGNPDYDYLLGTTAIDAGIPLQAVFALERVLDIQPNNAAARAELARAYFLIGENQAARAEFEQAKKAEMPVAARSVIDTYLSSIDQRILGGKQQTLAYVEAGLGYDSNINSANASSQITLPGFVITNNAPEKNAAVGRVEAGGSFSRALKTNLDVYGNGKLEFYQPNDASKYATRNTDGTVGLHFLRGREQYRLALVAQNYAVDSTTARNLAGINGQWQHTIDARNMLSLFAQYASLKYPDRSSLDASQLATGLSWVHAMDGNYQPVIYLAGYLGKEDEKDSANKKAGRNYVGLRAGGSLRSSERLSWSGVLAYQTSDYHGPDFFGITHNDNYINLELTANYQLAKGWIIQPKVTYTNNDSNVDISSYTRTQAMINMRKEI
jgi:outer membrane protein